jgi:parvulin-like peptidyl-prolyl isomerase
MKPLCNLGLLAGILLLFAACDRRAQPEAPRPSGAESVVLAQVGDRAITRADFDRELARRRGTQSQRYTTPAQLEQLLEEMIQFEVVLAAARSAGYDRDPEIQARINQFVVTRFQEDQLAAIESGLPTDAELQEYYESHQPQFSVPRAVRVALIQFKLSSKATAEKRDELRARVEELWNEARTGDAAAFGRLARQHSEDQATRYQGGEIGWNTREQLTERFGTTLSVAVFASVESGQPTTLIEVPDGFYLARLLEQRPQQVRPFAEVRDAITYEVSQRKELERQTKWFSQMQQKIRVKSYPDRLPPPVSVNQVTESRPPAVPKS